MKLRYGTENAVMAACLAQGITIIRHAVSGLMSKDFVDFLILQGEDFRIGSNILIYRGDFLFQILLERLLIELARLLGAGSFISLMQLQAESFYWDVNPDDIE